MNVKRDDRGSVTVLHLDGQLDLFTAKDFRQVFASLIEEGRKKIILDFSEVTYLDSSGVGALLHLFSEAKTANYELRFVNLKGSVAHVIELTKLTDYFPIREEIDSAIAELNES